MPDLVVVPLFKNEPVWTPFQKHGKPVSYIVHDVTDPHITLHPETPRLDPVTKRPNLSRDMVTFATKEEAQAWIDDYDGRLERIYEQVPA